MLRDNIMKRQDLNELIVTFVRERKPETFEQLVDMVEKLHYFSREEIVEYVLFLQNENKILLSQTRTELPHSFQVFIFSEKCVWFWIIVTIVLSAALATLTIPENAFPLVYIKYILSLPYVLLLPGYSALRAFFEIKSFQYLEQLILSLGLSIFFIFVLGLALNYLPWGITLGPIVLGLAVITLFSSSFALTREYRTMLQKLSLQKGPIIMGNCSKY